MTTSCGATSCADTAPCSSTQRSVARIYCKRKSCLGLLVFLPRPERLAFGARRCQSPLARSDCDCCTASLDRARADTGGREKKKHKSKSPLNKNLDLSCKAQPRRRVLKITRSCVPRRVLQVHVNTGITTNTAPGDTGGREKKKQSRPKKHSYMIFYTSFTPLLHGL